MEGKNELILNQSTICEAIDYWLKNKVWNANEPAPTVAKVSFTKDGHYETFIVILESGGKETP